MNRLWMTLSAAATVALAAPACARQVQDYDALPGGRGQDIAVTPDGEIWWTVQRGGGHGALNPPTGEMTTLPLGGGSGVIAGPDGAGRITDGGQNTIVRVDRATREGRGSESGTDRLAIIRQGG